MNGKGNVRFSDMFADTHNTHGCEWARQYYISNGMSVQEYDWWFNRMTK